jgi:hypothetical protein
MFGRRNIKIGLMANNTPPDLSILTYHPLHFKYVGIFPKFSSKLVSVYFKYRTRIYIYQCILYGLSPSYLILIVGVGIEAFY